MTVQDKRTKRIAALFDLDARLADQSITELLFIKSRLTGTNMASGGPGSVKWNLSPSVRRSLVNLVDAHIEYAYVGP